MVIRFCHNHSLLQVNDRPPWWTVRGGARHYVDAMLPVVHELRLATPVQHVRRLAKGGVALTTPAGDERFDAVVLAGHSGQSLALLATPAPAAAGTSRPTTTSATSSTSSGWIRR